MKTAREQLDIITAYAQLGGYRAAARLCGTTDKTVKRIIERQRTGELEHRARGQPRPRKAYALRELVRRRVEQTDGRISAKGCSSRHARLATEAPIAASAGWWPRRLGRRAPGAPR